MKLQEKNNSAGAKGVRTDPDHLEVVPSRRSGWRYRLGALFLTSTLDRQLAQGRSPEASGMLAARADKLVSMSERRRLAQRWEHLLLQARRPPAMRDTRVPLNRQDVIECKPAIQEMVNVLLSSTPTSVHGLAMASWLLGSGASPIFDRRLSGTLGVVLNDVIDELASHKEKAS